MTKAESDIFQFIATRSEGFKPSANYIAEETGWSRRKVFEAREQLVKFGIIGETDDQILIDWNRIRLLSTLDPSMTGRKCTVAPVALVR